MWRPLERIRHDSGAATWPTAEAAAGSRLFSPIRVGSLVLAHRTWVPAMVPWRASEDGDVSPQVLGWYERFARGRPAAIVVEATGFRDVPSGPLLRIGDDRFIPGLRELVRVVREASGGQTRLFIQIIDFLAIRRRPEPAKFFERYLAITAAHRAALGRPDASDPDVRRWSCLGCRSRRYRGLRTTVTRGSRLVRKGAGRSRRRSTFMSLHQLLRGARPAPSASHLRALGSTRAR